ncbi:hypothetical protein [Pseudomonas sp. MUP55]|uniref:hypothetical protein n=1 Tax=Pseudomonas sp. MUP55 TaxID=3087234 RepID=UPI002A5AFE17|nr:MULTISPECIES: hypothetical protein [unclassified Pseudomonas]WPN94682.1 hypothetical protein SC319_10005 [Pseudomonas sp. MUP56]WPO00209.1 hypothetical protein SC318_10005 [Pseudomonas sp. MUP55]
MTMTDKAQWINEITKVLNGPRNRVTEEKFHKLIYETPSIADSEVVDSIMRSFLKPFDSSVMQACTTTLGGIDFEHYYKSLFKILPKLLHQNPDSALCLLNYPGYELKNEHIQK